MEENREIYEQVNHRYKKIFGKYCAYCGELANTEDHVYPVSGMYALVCINGSECDLQSFIVPACNECNRIAGAMIFQTFEKKRTYIRDAIRSRYRKELAMNYTIEDLFYISSEEMFDIVSLMRKRSNIEHRLYYQHTYNLSVSSLKHINPSISSGVPIHIKKLKDKVKNKLSCNTIETNIYKYANSQYIVKLQRNGIAYTRGPFNNLEQAQLSKKELLDDIPAPPSKFQVNKLLQKANDIKNDYANGCTFHELGLKYHAHPGTIALICKDISD